MYIIRDYIEYFGLYGKSGIIWKIGDIPLTLITPLTPLQVGPGAVGTVRAGAQSGPGRPRFTENLGPGSRALWGDNPAERDWKSPWRKGSE